MKSELCAFCQKPATQKCSACNNVFYCNREHQKIDWKKNHKNNCVPYKTLTNDVIGRYLVATRDIPEGTTIMRNHPLVLGPKLATYPLCLGCHKKLDHFYPCSKCRWPLCGKECEKSVFHTEECKILEKSKYSPQINFGAKQTVYAPITILRCLLLKQKNTSESFSNLMSLQSHLEENMKSPVYNILKRTLVPLITHTLKIDNTDEKEILTICSILDTNSFDVRIFDGVVNIRSIYPTVSLVAHDCRQNTKHIIDDDYQITLISTVSIKKGEMITTSYTQPLWGTLSRRAHLKQVKHFDCTCKRCGDPTEFGTFTGSMFCPSCKNKNGAKIISSNPLNGEADWKCESCDYKVTASKIALENESLKREICCLNKSDPKYLENFLDKYKEKLHKKNCHVIEVKYALAQMYGHMLGYSLNELSEEKLERKILLCKELLEVADVLQPGLSKFRGTLLFDLQDATTEKLKKQFDKGLITKDEFKRNLKEVLDILNEANKILSLEPGKKDILSQKFNNLKTLTK